MNQSDFMKHAQEETIEVSDVSQLNSFSDLKANIQADQDGPGSYAYSWRDNIAMAIKDTWGDGSDETHELANRAASRFMQNTFDVRPMQPPVREGFPKGSLSYILKLAPDFPELWFRPLSREGCGEAFCLQRGRICVVPTPTGASPYVTTSITELTDTWTFVQPDDVNNELR